MSDVRERVQVLVRELLGRLDADTTVHELEVRQDGIRVRVAAGSARVDAPPSPASPPPQPSVSITPAAKAEAKGNTVDAPLTGIFYRSASPQSPPFVQVGTDVQVGDVIGLIEAMKLFNEIRAKTAGRVTRIVAENGQLVRAHHPLIELS